MLYFNRSKAVINWNKKHLHYTSRQTNKLKSSSVNNLNFNTNHVRTFGFSSVTEIPSIERNLQPKIVKPSNTAECKKTYYIFLLKCNVFYVVLELKGENCTERPVSLHFFFCRP